MLDREEMEEEDSQYEEELGFMPPGEGNEDDLEKKHIPLTDKLLENSVHESYKHS